MLAGVTAGIGMTVVMLLLTWLFGIATPLTIIGDRLSVFIKPGPFLDLMGRVGGYNHLKQLGVGSTIFGQLIVGALAGGIYALIVKPESRNSFWITLGCFFILPFLVLTALLGPVLGTNYHGRAIGPAILLTCLGLAFSFLAFERLFVRSLHYLRSQKSSPNELGYSARIGRRALVLGGLSIVLAGGGAAILRRLFQVATFSYDGTQYRGPDVQPITPNDKFYCVTKNVIDPQVNESHWRLEVTGLVQHRQTYSIARLRSLPLVTQETTLMCISNGIGAGLMSNAVWRGVPMRELLHAATPFPEGAKVRLHGVDNYTDTFPLAKAMDPETIIAFDMNGELLPSRHGFPARVIVPGYFGEKNVKWLTRIEVAAGDAKGFYEQQGWGPDFIIPTRSRFDQPDDYASFRLSDFPAGIPLKGIAFAGDRGISKVEVSLDGERTWRQTAIDYPGTKLTWALWSYSWKPTAPGEYHLAVRAVDGTGERQYFDHNRSPFSGVTGLHKITVYLAA
jgi:DMSO/TMAO reductase YedYZ molybdopterin-dependent catalytic subunit